MTINQALNKAVGLYKTGNIQDAKRLFSQVIQIEPNQADANHNMGRILLESGNSDKALPFFKTALEANFSLPQYWFSYIDVLFRLNRNSEASELLEIAKDKGCEGPEFDNLEEKLNSSKVELKTITKRLKKLAEEGLDDYLYNFQIGKSYQKIGELEKAIEAYNKALALKPDFADAYYNMGLALTDQGMMKEAVEAFNKAISLTPDYADSYFNMGNCLKHQGKLEEALEAYNKALSLEPNNADTYNNIGISHHKQGKPEEAIGAFKKALSLRPDYAEAYNNMGISLQVQGKLEQAFEAYKKALSLKPNYADAYSNMGNCLAEEVKLEGAVDAYKKALSLEPNNADTYNNMGISLQVQGKLEQAVKAYNKALTLKPNNAEAFSNLGNSLKDQGKLEEAIEAYKKALIFKPNFAEAYSNLLFCVSSNQHESPIDSLKLAKKFNDNLPSITKFTHDRLQATSVFKKLSIGFISGDLHNHPVGFFLMNLLQNIDKENYKIYIFSNSNKETKETKLLRSHTAEWYSISECTDAKAAQLIFDNSIDILIDLSGHTAKNRLPVFNYRPARIQMTWLGYFATTGLSEMDYILGDRFVLPTETKDHYSEEFALLPNSYLCFTPPEFKILVTSTPAIENKFITFGCFNNAKKVNKKVIVIWAEILKKTPRSKLFFKGITYVGDIVNFITQCFEENQIGSNRIIFEQCSGRDTLLKGYNHVDIALDPFPYPGGTTTCEALWMGVPTITKKGNDFLSNVGQTIAVNSGHQHLCTLNEEEYIYKSVSLGQDVKKLNQDRLKRRAKILKSPLFDGQMFAKDFGKLMKKISDTY